MPVVLDVAIPVFNDEGDLDRSVRRLRRYLDDRFPFPARITIVDYGSTDGTRPIARRLAHELAGVRALHLDSRGRGRAVRQAWLESDAAVVAYVDVDLSTGMEALLPLVAPLLGREPISRSYNLLLHAVLGTRISDAQGGFKAMRAVDFRLANELRTFAAVGLLSTLGYAACYSALRLELPAPIANAASLLLATIANTAANRRFTFKGAGRWSALRDHACGLAALTVALCLTTISMGGLRLLAPRAGLPGELALLTAANLVATAVRFAALRSSAAASPVTRGGSGSFYDLAGAA